MAFCFESQSNIGTITGLFQSINFYGLNIPYDVKLSLFKFLYQFKKNLVKDELTALYFWLLNQKYSCYLEIFETDNDMYSKKEFDREFGRSLTYKIYKPKDSGLEQETFEELKLLLCDFASEFDLLLIDECTTEQISAVMDFYCNSPNN